MMFCSEYFFCGDFDLNQFVENPARILAWYSFGEIGLFTFTTAKKLNRPRALDRMLLYVRYASEFVHQAKTTIPNIDF